MPGSDFSLVVEGVDGSEWPVHGDGAYGRPARLLEGSMGEFYDLPLSTQYRPRVGQPGSAYKAYRYLERHVVLNMGFFGDGWDHYESRFQQALSPVDEATLVVRTRLSGERRLKVRLEEAGEYKDGRDPFSRGCMIKQFTLIADDPFWYEPQPMTDMFVFDGANWTGGHVVVSNPTDTPAWPRWVCTAPAKFGLPDIDFSSPAESSRMVYLPFQPTGRDYVVDTDPTAEMIVATDNTQAWAKMGGQFFMNPIPPRTLEQPLPVYVDPFPLLPFDLPYQWRVWIAQRLRDLVDTVGVKEFLGWTPKSVGDEVAGFLRGVRPEWVPEVPADWISEMTGDFLANMLSNTIGKISNIAGATAQVRLERRWQRPWG